MQVFEQTKKACTEKQLQDTLFRVDAVVKQVAEYRNITDQNVLVLENGKTITPSTEYVILEESVVGLSEDEEISQTFVKL